MVIHKNLPKQGVSESRTKLRRLTTRRGRKSMQIHPAQYRSSSRSNSGSSGRQAQEPPGAASRCLGREAHPLVVEMLAKLAELEESNEYCEVLVAVSSSSPELETGDTILDTSFRASLLKTQNLSVYPLLDDTLRRSQMVRVSADEAAAPNAQILALLC